MDDASTLITKLRQDAERLVAYMQSISEDSRTQEVYAEGVPWTVRSVLIHLRSAEREFLRLFREIQQGGSGVDETFSIDDFNADEQAREAQLNWEEALSSFLETRQGMIDLIGTFTSAALEKTGRHPYLGATSLREMIKMIYIHDQTHLRDIRRAVGAG
jgi:uncharacterized damage-inducible protein DinB